jgi:predicted DNA-binding transcriptional regulator
MKLVEAVDKAKSIEELNEMIARIEEEESKELAQLEKELKKQNAKH